MMSDFEGIIESQELRLMQSWMHSDAETVRKLAARDCMMFFGSNPPQLLDRPSFIEAMGRDFRCIGFRMGECLIRKHGRMAWYTASCDLELKLGAVEWKEKFLITGLWRKFRIGGWKLVERSLSPLDKDERLAESLRQLQMWKS